VIYRIIDLVSQQVSGVKQKGERVKVPPRSLSGSYPTNKYRLSSSSAASVRPSIS